MFDQFQADEHRQVSPFGHRVAVSPGGVGEPGWVVAKSVGKDRRREHGLGRQ